MKNPANDTHPTVTLYLHHARSPVPAPSVPVIMYHTLYTTSPVPAPSVPATIAHVLLLTPSLYCDIM